MCLKLKDKEPRILSKEELISLFKKTNNSTITAYKILRITNKGYETPYQNYPIELNTHYYNEGENKFTFFKDYSNMLELHQGLHAYTSFKKAKSRCGPGNRVVVKCIIPKGSEYFINKNKHEICSDNLIITDQILYKKSI
jgi:hypothetical protein